MGAASGIADTPRFSAYRPVGNTAAHGGGSETRPCSMARLPPTALSL